MNQPHRYPGQGTFPPVYNQGAWGQPGFHPTVPANQLGKRDNTGHVKEEEGLDERSGANKRFRKTSDGGKNNDGLSDDEDEEEEEEDDEDAALFANKPTQPAAPATKQQAQPA